jgi:hypothetical protein
MNSVPTIASWERKLYSSGGGDATLCYFVFGNIGEGLEVSATKYNTNGPPPEMLIGQYTRATDPEIFEGLFGYYATKRLSERNPSLYAAIEQAPSCLKLLATIEDPDSLDYLRDTIGVIAALLDQGGVAVFDLLTLTWWSKDDWQETFFASGKPNLHRHINIMISETEEHPEVQDWLHTRGMLKFGRRDLSMSNVPQHLIDPVAFLFDCLAEDQALGVQIADGQTIDMAGLPSGITCHHAGNMDDLDFNNVHLELHLPQ